MISKGFVFSVLVMAGISVSSPISSQVAFQGILTDGSGNSYKDSTGYKVTFTLYADSVLNAEVWTEELVVSTKQGVFSVMLGSVQSLDTVKFEQQYWLGVKRDNGGQIGKRIKLGVTPYSKRALSADTANYAKVADSALSVNGVIIKGKSIDNSKIADSTITTGKIKNGTILSEDVDTGFKAPFAGVADSAKNISLVSLHLTGTPTKNGLEILAKNDVVNNLSDASEDKPLSAAQGMKLNENISKCKKYYSDFISGYPLYNVIKMFSINNFTPFFHAIIVGTGVDDGTFSGVYIELYWENGVIKTKKYLNTTGPSSSSFFYKLNSNSLDIAIKTGGHAHIQFNVFVEDYGVFVKDVFGNQEGFVPVVVE
jgi:hypothetical protein